VRLFQDLSVLRNVEVSGLAVGLSRREARRRAWEALERVDLAHRAELPASALPLGEERRVSLARAAATGPKFLLLDEPAAGLSETEIVDMMQIIGQLCSDENCGVLLIEHDMTVVMGLCERIQVLDTGKTICMGAPQEVQADQRVIAAYLGTGGS
jgi:branched-chain amino acid transport system ATP-binding protein